MEPQNSTEQTTPTAHKNHKIVIGVLGLIIVALVVALLTKTSEAPSPEALPATEETEEVEMTEDGTETEAVPAEEPGEWTAPAANPPSAPSLPSTRPSTNNTISDSENLAEEVTVPSSVVITYRDGRFWPDEALVVEGGMVHFMNQSDEPMWVASDNHPKHDRYLEKSNAKCGTSDFDQCGTIESGQSWSFAFNRSGTWGYHNHVNAKHTGTVVVVDKDEL